ncbi:hypothetical protein HZS_6065 [Henneguya salminicola]|nr:hypothetical protein HZS_6065 [Henneguya salminicola]
MFLSHAFCPYESVLHYFESFKNCFIENGRMDRIMEILKYFENYFIGYLHRNIRKQSLFVINILNQFTRIMRNVPRTNNIAEGNFEKKSCR